MGGTALVACSASVSVWVGAKVFEILSSLQTFLMRCYLMSVMVEELRRKMSHINKALFRRKS